MGGKIVVSDWEDCWKWLPYRDSHGRWRIPLAHTQRRFVWRGSARHVEYRERAETLDEQDKRLRGDF